MSDPGRLKHWQVLAGGSILQAESAQEAGCGRELQVGSGRQCEVVVGGWQTRDASLVALR